MPGRILLAEDDRATRQSLVRALELEGYQVHAVSDGAAALQQFDRSRPDLLVVDVMMPDVDGLTLCRRVRARDVAVPILMVTARTEVPDRVSGLDAGADDYLPKPFALDELLARVRSLLRRRPAPDGAHEVQVADLRVSSRSRQAWRGDEELALTKTEFDLLELLARNTGVVLSHRDIYQDIWGYDFGPTSKSLAVYIGYLRRKVEAEDRPRLIHTVRGVGYTLRVE